MNKTVIIRNLIRAYREADVKFAAAQTGPSDLVSGEFARIIGILQAEIKLALIDLGHDVSDVRVVPVSAVSNA